MLRIFQVLFLTIQKGLLFFTTSKDNITEQDYEQRNKGSKRDPMYFRRKMVFADKNFCYKIVPAFFFSSLILLWTIYFMLLYNTTNTNDLIKICELIIDAAKFLSETLIITIFLEKCLYMLMANKIDTFKISKDGLELEVNNQKN